MPKYVFVYRAPKGFVPGQAESVDAWTQFGKSLEGNLVDFGNPVFESSNLGTCDDDSTQLGGYSFVTADDLESAVALAKRSPTLRIGGGVEVGEITEM
jgi:hypothetical protein